MSEESQENFIEEEERLWNLYEEKYIEFKNIEKYIRFRKKENESIDSFKRSTIELNREYTITDKVLWVE